MSESENAHILSPTLAGDARTMDSASVVVDGVASLLEDDQTEESRVSLSPCQRGALLEMLRMASQSLGERADFLREIGVKS